MSADGKNGLTGFYAEEITRALEEQLFGIKAFAVLSADASHAVASVDSLEGETFTIRLNSLGYQITAPPKDTIFDYIDSLLQSVSPQYETRRHELWVKKLSNITSTRAEWPEEGDL